MTQQPLFPVRALSLADRVRAWAERHDGAAFDALCEAMRAGLAEAAWPSACEVDAAAREVGALRWREGTGFEVGLVDGEGEEKRR